jgi:hypothetical protein
MFVTQQTHRSHRPGRLALVALVTLIAPSIGSGQEVGAGLAQGSPWEWPAEVEGPLRTFFEREDVEAILGNLAAPDAGGMSTIGGVSRTIGGDVEQLFRFVQRRLTYEPYAGSIRGSDGALRAGSGNALDQALLLRDLLEMSGHQARLAHGRLEWQHAVVLTGEVRTEAPSRGDPWLRRVEIASDHWWVEVRVGGGWVAADPSFPGAALGEAMGRRTEALGAVPARLVATARLEVTVGPRTLARLEVPVPELFGAGVKVRLAGPADAAGEGAAEPEIEIDPGNAGRDTTDAGLAGDEPPDPLDPAPVEAALPVVDPGPIVLEVVAAGRRVVAAPVPRQRLGDVRVEFDIEVPPGRHVRAVLPFGADPLAQLTIVVSGGEVRQSAYARQLEALYAALRRLVTVEVEALEAWRLRPREDVEATRNEGVLGPEREGFPRSPAMSNPALEVEPLVHPAIELHVAAIKTWEVFADQGVEAIGLALLAAADQLHAPVAVERPDVRLVGLHFKPATPVTEGDLTAWIADPARVGGPADTQRVATQMALGLLQSAVAGQVLNRLADRPPVTAYDLTLRAVGSGSRLSWFQRGGNVPAWPAEAVLAARSDLNAGNTVVGPSSPIRRGDRDLLAWWAMAPASGQTAGRIQQPLGAAQAAVAIGPPVDLRSLDSILASLHDLHVAGGWLLTLGDADRNVLRDLVPGACAATPLVADLLRAGAPPNFVPPAFAAFCQSGVPR